MKDRVDGNFRENKELNCTTLFHVLLGRRLRPRPKPLQQRVEGIGLWNKLCSKRASCMSELHKIKDIHFREDLTYAERVLKRSKCSLLI